MHDRLILLWSKCLLTFICLFGHWYSFQSNMLYVQNYMIDIPFITVEIHPTELGATDLPTTVPPAITIIDESDGNIYGNEFLSIF